MKAKFFTLLLLLPVGLMAQTVTGIYNIGPGSTSSLSPGLTITSTGTMNNLGTVAMDGDLEIDGTITAMHTLEYMGSANWRYIGIPMTLDSIIMNNDPGITISLSAPVTVRQGVQFNEGLLASTTANPLIINSGAGVGAPTDGSHVNGPVMYMGTSPFTFPVGDATYYRPVSVNLTGNGSGITATYFGGAAPAGSLTTPLKAVSAYEYWTVTPVSTASGAVTLNWDASKTGVGIENTLGVAAVQVAMLSGGSWSGQGGVGTGTPAAGTVTSNAVPSGSWGSSNTAFALGSTDINNAPLPLTFLGIDAALLADGTRKIDWQVASELRLKDYTVERSADGQQFTEIGVTPATGGTSYSYVDVSPAPGSTLFYRVRGNDLDGKATYSSIVTIRTDGAASWSIEVAPNPVKDRLMVQFGAGTQGRYSLDLLTIDGRRCYHTEMETTGNQRYFISRPGDMSRGIYIARLSDATGHVRTYKLVFE